MAREMIEGQKVHILIPSADLKRADKIAKRTGTSRSALVRKALDAYLTVMEKRAEKAAAKAAATEKKPSRKKAA